MITKSNATSTAALCIACFTMLFILSQLMPYGGFMVIFLFKDGSVDEDNAGFYAGILTSSFMIGRAITAILWGSVADSYGRKFVLVITLVSSLVGSLAFGLSTSFYSALTIRFTMGLFNGTMVVVRTMVSELAKGDKEAESKGVAHLFSMVGYSMLLSPALGGLLSEPLEQHPNSAIFQTFSGTLSKYPFLLPNLAAAILSALALLFVVLGVEETLPEDQCRPWISIGSDVINLFRNSFGKMLAERDNLGDEWSQSFSVEAIKRISALEVEEGKPSFDKQYAGEDTPLIGSSSFHSAASISKEFSAEEGSSNSSSSFDFLQNPKLRTLLGSYWVYTFCSVAQSEAFPLFAMSRNGGLGIDETSIGITVGISGLIYTVGQYYTFTTCLKHFGVVKTMQHGALGACLPLILMPLGLYMTGWTQTLYLATVMGTILIWGNVFLGSSTMATNQSVAAHQRARMNGVSGLGTSIARAAGPIAAGALVSFAMSSGYLPEAFGGWFVYGALLLSGFLAYRVSLLIPEEERGDVSVKTLEL